MRPTSDQLEGFLDRLREVHRQVSRLKGGEVRKAATLQTIKALCREWMRLSAALRSFDCLPPRNLDATDGVMADMLERTNNRTRPSAYKNLMNQILPTFMDEVVVPVIRFEGSPPQVAARQLLVELGTSVSEAEQAYLEEAAQCLGNKCSRAAIIMLWAAAMARFHAGIEKVGFATLNAAVQKLALKSGNPFSRLSKGMTVASLPELQKCRDFDLLVAGMELWNYDLQVFEELERLLGTRNTAAHPGMLRPQVLDVQQFASKVGTYVLGIVPA